MLALKYEKNKLNDLISNGIDKRQKGLLIKGIMPKTFIWVMGKIKILSDLEKELHIKLIVDLEAEKQLSGLKAYYRIKAALFLKKIGMLRWWIIFLIFYISKLPYKFKPKWFYIMDGHKLLIDESDVANLGITKDYTLLKIWEPETTKIVKENVKTGNVCIDIGASIGYFTLLFARQVGDTGKVISFEPTQRCFKYQIENIKANGYKNIIPNRLAAWDKKEIVKMPINDPNPFISQGVSVDDWLEENKIGKVDFIKIDVDGSEPNVLKGLIRTFEKNPNLKMVIEYYPKYIEDAGLSTKEFRDIISEYFNFSAIPGDYSENCWNLFCQRK